MGTPTADKLRAFFSSQQVASNYGALPTYVADAACTRSLIKDSARAESNGYWNGASGVFLGDVTPELAGQQFHVKSYVVGELTLYKNVSVAPAAGDGFKLVKPGGYTSSYELFALAVSGAQPELAPVDGTNVTGITIKKASRSLGAGTLSLFYDQSAALLFAKMGSDPYGVGLDVSGDLTNAIVFTADGQHYVQLDVDASSLPGSDQTDTFTLTIPSDTFVPDMEGDETAASTPGKTRYHLHVVRNLNGSDGTMVSLTATPVKPAGAATTIASGSSLGTVAAAFVVDDATNWPERAFWVKNTDKNDCRYVNYRSGNSLTVFGVDWALLFFDGGVAAITQGQTVTDVTSGATAVVDQILVTSGSYGGSNAVGFLILKAVSGSFGDNHNIQVGGVTKVVANGNATKGLRGLAAVAWDDGDAIELMSDVDIGRGTATSDQFEAPANHQTMPTGVAFSDLPIDLGHLENDERRGIWLRETIPAGAQARANIDMDVNFSWT